MRQLTFVAPKCVEWCDVPTPTLSTDASALVRPLAVARCDLDLYIASGLYPMQPPFALGHEMAGEVIDVGDGVRHVEPGDRVMVPFQISCGACAPCRKGQTNACASVPARAAYGFGPQGGGGDFGGALSDCVLVPYADAMLVPVPDGMDLSVAAGLADNVSDGYRTVAPHLERDPGASILVVGGLGQSVGLYAVHAAVTLGAERVIYTDSDPARLAFADTLGAEPRRVSYDADLRAQETFPITVDASGTPVGLHYAVRSTAACGVCTSISGGVTRETALPLQSMYAKGITYEVSRVHARATLDPVLDHVTSGRLRPEVLITRRASFDEAPEALFDPDVKVVFTA